MSQPWTPAPSSGATANIPNYLIPAILATIFCCLPVGVVSIIFAAQVSGKISAGDMAGAMDASRKAKMFMFIAVGAGVLTYVIVIVMWIFVFGLAAMGSR
jgi:hypothetical protein